MSQPPQQAAQYLDNLIGKLYQALSIKFSDILNAFDTVLPDPRVGFNGHYFIPLPTGVKQQAIQYTWQDFYRKDVLNQLVQVPTLRLILIILWVRRFMIGYKLRNRG